MKYELGSYVVSFDLEDSEKYVIGTEANITPPNIFAQVNINGKEQDLGISIRRSFGRWPEKEDVIRWTFMPIIREHNCYDFFSPGHGSHGYFSEPVPGYHKRWLVISGIHCRDLVKMFNLAHSVFEIAGDLYFDTCFISHLNSASCGE